MATPVTRWGSLAQQAAARYGIPASVLLGLIQTESSGNPGETSSTGAKGITQFEPETAAQYGVNSSPGHERSQVFGAAHYLKDLGFAKDPAKALASYNAGPGNPAAGAGYANTVLARAKEYKGYDGSGALTPPTAPTAPSVAVPATTAAADTSSARSQLAASWLSSSSKDPRDLALQLVSLKAATPAAAPAAGPAHAPSSSPRDALLASASVAGAKPGVPVAHLTSEEGLHPTAGLPGYPAHDFMAPSGSAAVAPVGGKIIRFSGHDPAEGPVDGPHGPLGWSIYLQGTDGKTYFLTHLGSRTVKVGQTVKAGQKIGTVADYAKYGTPSHIHMGVHG